MSLVVQLATPKVLNSGNENQRSQHLLETSFPCSVMLCLFNHFKLLTVGN